MINCSYILQEYISLDYFIVVAIAAMLVLVCFVVGSFGLGGINLFGCLAILFGGLSNVIDRADGCVNDPLSIFGLSYNTSDVLILIGLFVIILYNYDYFINRR